MPAKTIDIHPHIIADDPKRYPLAPLGGHQSDWSRTRPVTTEQMIAAMDEAGVDKSAMVQASTCYGHDNSYVADAVAAHPDRFTGVFSVDVLAPDAPEKMRHWREQESHRHAALHHRQHDDRPRPTGSTIPRSTRPGRPPASSAFRSACRCRARRSRSSSTWCGGSRR